MYGELNERAEAATSSYCVTGDFLQYIYSVPVTKSPQNIRSRCLVNEFSLTDIFQRYQSWLQSRYIEEKFFMAASVLYDCGYSFLLSKGAQNDAENHWHEIPQYYSLTLS